MEPTAPIPLSQKSATPQEKKEAPVARVIRTMKSDIAEAIAKQNETAASIALAEAKKQERERAAALAAAAAKQAQAPVATPTPKRRGRITLIIIIVVLLVGGRIAYKLFVPALTKISLSSIKIPWVGTSTPETPAISTPPKPILATAILTPQSEKRFTLGTETPEHVSAGIAVERTGGVNYGVIKNFYFLDQSGIRTALAKDVFVFMGVQMPDTLLRSLDAPFMFGLIGGEQSVATPFIILKTTDYNIVRAGMLTWESSLPGDFDILFGTKIAAATSAAKFTDTIIAGKDARVFGTIPNASLFYTFFDSRTVVITSSQSALERLVQQLSTI